MTIPVRLQRSRQKGFHLQAASLTANDLPAINVARPDSCGNPIVVGKRGDAASCAELYTALLAGMLRVGADPQIDQQEQVRCHADVLLVLANRDSR